MAQQTLQTMVTIGGRVDNSFGQIGEALIGLGSMVDVASQQLIDFGKESLEDYVSYDDLMREVQAVGEFSDAQIKSLDAINSSVAKNTTYSNIQAAEAEVIMGQYGMTVQEIATMLPSALDLAMAGNLSLSDSVDYLYSTLKSTNNEVGYVGTLTDQMAKTAAIGATDIDTLGDSVTRLGSGAEMFKGGTVEIFSVLSAISQFGEDMRGSEAGTWIRNFMLSLAAPMGNVDEIVSAMEELGVAQEDIDEYAEGKENGVAAEAVNKLVEAGLRIYDENDKLLPAIDIIKSLRDTVRGSGEYTGDLTELSGALDEAGGDLDAFATKAEGLTDNALYNIFRKIFGRRGVATALNLIRISDDEWAQTTSAILNSEGFADAMVGTMQGGLGGSQRGLEAAFTEFKTSVGKTLEPIAADALDSAKELLLSLDSIDEGKMSAITAALVPLAAAGPALMGAGLAFRLIGYAMTPIGAAGLGLIALVSAAQAMQKLREADMADQFGEMEMDAESLSLYVQTLGTTFKDSYTEVQTFSAALDTAVASYQTASQAFSGSLLTAVLTGNTLTDEDRAGLLSLGGEMGDQLTAGILASTSATMSNLTRLFNGQALAEDDPAYNLLMGALASNRDELLTNAAELSDSLREELLSAFEDGEISQDEYDKIKAWFEAYNEAIAKIAREMQSEEDAIALQVMLHKAQTGTYEDAQTYGGQILDQRDETLATLEEEYLHDYYKAKLALDQQVADGQITETQREYALAELEASYNRDVQAQSAPYNASYQRLWDVMLGESDLSGAYSDLRTLAESVMQGGIGIDDAVKTFADAYGKNAYAGDIAIGRESERQQLTGLLAQMIAGQGGDAAFASDEARQILFLMEGIAAGKSTLKVENGNVRQYASPGIGSAVDPNTWEALYSRYIAEGIAENGQYTVDSALALISIDDRSGNIAEFWSAVGALADGTGSVLDVMTAHQNLLDGQEAMVNDIINSLPETYDIGAVLADMGGAEKFGDLSDMAAAYSLLFGPASLNPDRYLLPDELEPVELPVDIDDAVVDDFLNSAQGTLSANPGLWIVQIQSVGGVSLGGGGGAADGTKGSGNTGGTGGLWSNFLSQLNQYAEGGRAAEASIFGEDGAEWAIPEEHSKRTADLLSQAAAASGFTWPELITRNGGLNADASHKPAQLVYAPVITVKDAKGVAKVLSDDKERFEKWYAEMKLRDEMESFV